MVLQLQQLYIEAGFLKKKNQKKKTEGETEK